MSTNMSLFQSYFSILCWFSFASFCFTPNDPPAVKGSTLMLLVANHANTKWCKTPKKWPKPWQMGTQELSSEYQQDRVCMVFKYLCIPVLWTKVASALEGLRAWKPGTFIYLWDVGILRGKGHLRLHPLQPISILVHACVNLRLSAADLLQPLPARLDRPLCPRCKLETKIG